MKVSKNIHVLPTDKPSILIKDIWKNTFSLVENFNTTHTDFKAQHIYITNDEEIKEGDWMYDIDGDIGVAYGSDPVEQKIQWEGNKKIILTTDQDLIKDGVQAIDDEFLEWFCKNSSCESVEVIKLYNDTCKEQILNEYEIIIPKEEPKPIHKFNNGRGATLCGKCYVIISEGITEELYCEKCKPKQETLEEAAERINYFVLNGRTPFNNGFKEGAKWQQERSYSEEDMRKAIQETITLMRYKATEFREHENTVIEQFKKK
jgi:hypothetical protein